MTMTARYTVQAEDTTKFPINRQSSNLQWAKQAIVYYEYIFLVIINVKNSTIFFICFYSRHIKAEILLLPLILISLQVSKIKSLT
jgi:hypothetical protein